MSFGQKLKESREGLGMSQEELAELVDVSRQSVSKWEMDNCYPKVEKLLAVCKKLDISLDYLFQEELE